MTSSMRDAREIKLRYVNMYRNLWRGVVGVWAFCACFDGRTNENMHGNKERPVYNNGDKYRNINIMLTNISQI